MESKNRRDFVNGLRVGGDENMSNQVGWRGRVMRDYWKEGAFQVQIKSWYKEIPQKSTGIPQLRLPARVDM